MRSQMVVWTFRIRCPWILLIAWLSLGAGVPRAETATDTPLESRTRLLLEAASKARTESERLTLRAALASKADSLEAAGADALASRCLERAGMLSYQLSDYETMRDVSERGVAAARRSGDERRVAALLNLQAIHRSITGDDEGAIRLQLDLIGMRERFEDVRGQGIGWHNLAYSYFALFRYPEGIDAIRRSIRLHGEAGNEYGRAASLSALANALFDVGRHADALAMADSAVTRARALRDPSLLGSALQGRGRQRHYAGRHAESIEDYEEAHDVLTAAGGALLAAVNDVNWASALESVGRCPDARRILDDANAVLADVGTPDARLFGACVDASIRARCESPVEARAALRRTIERLEAVRDSIPDIVARSDALRLAGDAYTILALLDVEDARGAEAWRTIEAGTARSLREELGAEVTTLAALQATLRALDAAALQFGYGTSDRNVACLVTATDVFAEAVPIDGAFRRDVESALRLMASGSDDAGCAAVLERVSAELLAPITSRLPDVTRLILFPGDMSGFPVDALPLSDGEGDALGERFAVTYAPSATAFVVLQGRRSDGDGVLVLADPDLGASPGDLAALPATRMSLTPLPHARAEGRAVGGSGTVLVGAGATRAALSFRAPGANVLHVAAHAVVDPTHPAHSGIVLAGAPGGTLVTAPDIRALTLGADFVSLSGCATAGGYQAMGDGAFGLTRAFLLAGARSVVSSWWKVEDAAAGRFMVALYERLRSGRARDVALRDVRRWMAQEGYPHRDRSAFALAGATGEPVAALVPGTSLR